MRQATALVLEVLSRNLRVTEAAVACEPKSQNAEMWGISPLTEPSTQSVVIRLIWASRRYIRLALKNRLPVIDRVASSVERLRSCPDWSYANMSQPKTLPIILNWQAFLKKKQLLKIDEFPLFTDAWVTGEASVGPYKFINTIAMGSPETVKMGVVLRYSLYREWEHPDFSKTDASLYHGGSPPEELAAFASLIVGVRFRAGDSIRHFGAGDPLGTPRQMSQRSRPYLPPTNSLNLPSVAKGQHPLGGLSLLESLLTLPVPAVVALTRAARLYQDALWLAESQPELTWLLLVSSLEAVANQWDKQKGTSVERLEHSKPELFEYLSGLADNEVLQKVADAFGDSMGVGKKFVDFCTTFVPDPPPLRPEFARFPWNEKGLKEALRKVYSYRSRALHDGVPFPAPICGPPDSQPGWQAPSEAPSYGVHQNGSTWLSKDLPMHLHLFEYVARTGILNWWKQCASSHASG